jgi:hypothetical protein
MMTVGLSSNLENHDSSTPSWLGSAWRRPWLRPYRPPCDWHHGGSMLLLHSAVHRTAKTLHQTFFQWKKTILHSFANPFNHWLHLVGTPTLFSFDMFFIVFPTLSNSPTAFGMRPASPQAPQWMAVQGLPNATRCLDLDIFGHCGWNGLYWGIVVKETWWNMFLPHVP